MKFHFKNKYKIDEPTTEEMQLVLTEELKLAFHYYGNPNFWSWKAEDYLTA